VNVGLIVGLCVGGVAVAAALALCCYPPALEERRRSKV